MTNLDTVRSSAASLIQLERGKIPPQALDLEEVVLGAMLIDKKGVDEIIDIPVTSVTAAFRRFTGSQSTQVTKHFTSIGNSMSQNTPDAILQKLFSKQSEVNQLVTEYWTAVAGTIADKLDLVSPKK